MTVVAERAAHNLATPAVPTRSRLSAKLAGPALLSALNSALFLIVRPDVNDLWAARARASAASHGVGLTYWFDWFGGGSTPGNYSILTPYLSAVITAELVGALSALAITIACHALLRGTAHPLAGAYVATFAAGVNLWSGRIPFLLSSAFAVGALIAVRRKNRWAAAGLTVVSVSASPVPAAFIAVACVGAFLTRKEYRAVCASTLGVIAACLGIVAIAFGTPGPEPFSFGLCLEVAGGLVLFLFARPPDYLKATICVGLLTAFLLFFIPNGMGSNFARFAWFWLPVAVVATSRIRTVALPVLVVVPMLLAGSQGTVVDLRNAGQPMSSKAYYQPLARELDRLGDLGNYRVEVVSHGAHAAYDALLNHAMLARGWETQEDNALNATLMDPGLDAITYKVWLDNNAVGYIAMPTSRLDQYPEYDLVAQGLPYLRQVWSSADWQLFRVVDPSRIVAAPAALVAHTQSQLTITVPCTCSFSVRVRWSKFLHAAESAGRYQAKVTDDGSGWTLVTTTGPGTYYLHGSIKRIFG